MTTLSQRRDIKGATLFGGVPQVEWVPEMVVELQRLREVKPKMNSAQIAAAIGYGLTKGAITGKVWRLRHGHSHRPRIDRLPRERDNAYAELVVRPKPSMPKLKFMEARP